MIKTHLVGTAGVGGGGGAVATAGHAIAPGEGTAIGGGVGGVVVANSRGGAGVDTGSGGGEGKGAGGGRGGGGKEAAGDDVVVDYHHVAGDHAVVEAGAVGRALGLEAAVLGLTLTVEIGDDGIVEVLETGEDAVVLANGSVGVVDVAVGAVGFGVARDAGQIWSQGVAAAVLEDVVVWVGILVAVVLFEGDL